MADYCQKYTLPELMAASVAREIKDGELGFIGIGMPLIAALVAKFTHAPKFNLMMEYGTVGTIPLRLPMDVCCTVDNERSYFAGSQREVMGAQQAGFVDFACISGAQIDKYGNLNSTCIGDYCHPKVRLAGSGGANDLASSVNRTIIMMRQDSRNFVNKVDYITSPGYLSGSGEREKAGLVGAGPVALITTMGIYRFDADTCEMFLEKIHPGVSLEKLKATVPWSLAVSPDLTETELPTAEQIMIMRTLDPLEIYLGTGRRKLTNNFAGFMKMFEDSYQPMIDLMRSKGVM